MSSGSSAGNLWAAALCGNDTDFDEFQDCSDFESDVPDPEGIGEMHYNQIQDLISSDSDSSSAAVGRGQGRGHGIPIAFRDKNGQE